MEPTTTTDADADAHESTDHEPVAGSEQDYVEEELLVEEVSIDGMCGVY